METNHSVLTNPESHTSDTLNIPRAEAWANLDELTKNAAKENPLLSFVELPY